MVKCGHYSTTTFSRKSENAVLLREELNGFVYSVYSSLRNRMDIMDRESFIHGREHPESLGAIGELWHLYCGHDDERRDFINSRVYIIATLRDDNFDNRVVGGSYYQTDTMGNIIVAKDMRNKGIGSSILKLHEKFGRRKVEFGWSNSSECYKSIMGFFSKHAYEIRKGDIFTLAIKKL